jgi:hypothetical protein
MMNLHHESRKRPGGRENFSELNQNNIKHFFVVVFVGFKFFETSERREREREQIGCGRRIKKINCQ